MKELFDLDRPYDIDDTLFQVWKEQRIEESIEYTFNPNLNYSHVQPSDIMAGQPEMSRMH